MTVNEDQINYIHIRRTKNGKFLPSGGLTIAYIVEESGDLCNIFLNYSKCPNKVGFNKKSGRTFAAQRLKANKESRTRGNVEISLLKEQVIDSQTLRSEIISSFLAYLNYHVLRLRNIKNLKKTLNDQEKNMLIEWSNMHSTIINYLQVEGN